MDDERIEHALMLGPVDEPAYQRGVRARLRQAADVASEAHAAVRGVDSPELASPTRIDLRTRGEARTSHRARVATLAQIAAVLVVIVVVGTLALPGIVGGPAPKADMLERLLAAGSMRILVPEGAPQTVLAGGVRVGFDIDVAEALADELSVEPNVLPVGVDQRLPATGWDVSAGLPDLGTSGVSQPYASWPAWLATAAGSGPTTLDRVVGHPICIVRFSAAEGWLRNLPVSAVGPSGPTVVRASSDDECIATLVEGRVDALVTSTLFDDELASRGLVAVGTEPVAYEPRVVRLSATGEDATSLLAAVDGAIDRLRASGRLAELSRQSFGGRDLTEVTR